MGEKWDDETVREWIEDTIINVGGDWSPSRFKEGDDLDKTTVEQLERVMELMTSDGDLEQLPDGQYRASMAFLREHE